MSETAIKVENLSKVYKLYDKPIDRMKESLHPFRKKYHKDFYAIKDVSFEIKKGETVGIVGKNGSGKSTLLKILTGVLTQTTGIVQVNGKVSALLELGAGFNPEFTGLENVYFQGSIMGYSREQMDSKIEDILSFADIGDFINQPVKTYSSGMFVRLAFAVSINVDPEIFIVDEALAVGDMRFVQKCLRKIADFRDEGKTIVMVTHDVGTVLNFAKRALWVNDGSIRLQGPPEQVVKEYTANMFYDNDTVSGNKNSSALIEDKKNDNDILFDQVASCDAFGEKGAEITGFALYGANGEKNPNVRTGDLITAFIKVESKEEILSPGIGILFKDGKGNGVFSINNYVYQVNFNDISANQRLIFKISFVAPPLSRGEYPITVAISSGTQEKHFQHHWVHDVGILRVVNSELKYNIGCLLAVDESLVKIEQII
jgi:ABC-type polysaccharide/polyol phosphate transport system ATPase subunit